MTVAALHHWLMTDTPASRRQAAAGNAYRGLLAILTNPAALAGLLIVSLLLVVAAFAPLLCGRGFTDCARSRPPSCPGERRTLVRHR